MLTKFPDVNNQNTFIKLLHGFKFIIRIKNPWNYFS